MASMKPKKMPQPAYGAKQKNMPKAPDPKKDMPKSGNSGMGLGKKGFKSKSC